MNPSHRAIYSYLFILSDQLNKSGFISCHFHCCISATLKVTCYDFIVVVCPYKIYLKSSETAKVNVCIVHLGLSILLPSSERLESYPLPRDQGEVYDRLEAVL